MRVQVFARCEQAGEVRDVAGRGWPPCPEIAGAEAVRDSDYGRTHRAVLVQALSPGRIGVEPKCESHSAKLHYRGRPPPEIARAEAMAAGSAADLEKDAVAQAFLVQLLFSPRVDTERGTHPLRHKYGIRPLDISLVVSIIDPALLLL
jgi:hypothetical protein